MTQSLSTSELQALLPELLLEVRRIRAAMARTSGKDQEREILQHQEEEDGDPTFGALQGH